MNELNAYAKSRFPLLRIISRLFRIAAIVQALIYLFVFARSIDFGDQYAYMRHMPGHLGWYSLTQLFFQLVGALVLWAVAEGIMLFISMEKNTFETKLFLRRREVPGACGTDSGTSPESR